MTETLGPVDVAPGLIIAAPASGAGKTTVSLALLRHLAKAGVAVASAKAGPDYIDPAFHAAASGRPCVNLDPWAMRESTLRGLVARLSAGGELVLCEGVMGLFDGACLPGRPDAGSTADLAALTGWPVVLVVDAAR
ncbi:MAG: cobyrinic acid a,c-diamide synthase, partial [Alphaproteobacteria bacterium]